ncbi:MAG: RodZ domain-containing protein [Acidobacteriota bacterium]
MDSIGDRLRQERLRRGLDIDRLAEQTKINPSMLEAIEADDLEKLPGSFFTRSFVRQYARALGLDEEEFEPELKRLTAAEEPEPEVIAEETFPPAAAVHVGPRTRDRRPLGALIAFLLIVAACSGIYALWQKTHATAPAGHEKTPPVVVIHPPEPVPATSAPAPVEEPKPQQPVAAPVGNAPIRIQMHATGEAWVRVVVDGQAVYSGILNPDETKSFEGQSSANVRVGDPAALQVTWNEKPVGEIGPPGRPRTVQFTPEGFKVLSPASPAPPAAPVPPPAVPDDGL